MKFFEMILAMLCISFFITGCDGSRAKELECQSNLKQIGISLMIYGVDYDNRLPPEHNEAGLQFIVKSGISTDTEVFHCPALKNNETGYYYIGGLIMGDSKFGRENFPIVFDKPGNHGNQVNVLFMGGYIESIEIPNYQNPEDVIKVAGEKAKLSQEDIAFLLERCREM